MIELLEEGSAVLLIMTWDTPGVIAAGRKIADAIEHPSQMEWDSSPPLVERWLEWIALDVRLGGL
jgi:hypothetical protein